MNYEDSDFLIQLGGVIRLAEDALTYERIFDLTGISDLLRTMYIETVDLPKEYVDILYKTVKDFIKQPLYKSLDLKNDKDLTFLRSDRDFVSLLKKRVSDVKEKLVPRHFKVLDFILKQEDGKHIPIQEVLKATKFDLATLLFILDDLKKLSKIYDYNGREVVLK